METLTTESGTITVGMEATVNYGSDSHPAKVESIERIRGGYMITLREYNYHADEKAKSIGMGHQEWIIDWDKPSRQVQLKIRLNGKAQKGYTSFTSISLGYARAYYCWEF